MLRKRPRSELSTRDPDAPPELDLPDGARCLFVGRQNYGCVSVVLPDPGRGLSKSGAPLPSAGTGAARSSYVIRVQPSGANIEGYSHRAQVNYLSHYYPVD